jgi:putative DNA primase/helicase
MGSLWMAVAAAGELPAGARSGRLELVTTDRENDGREIRVRWLASLAKRWIDVPMMFLDATADAAVLTEVFGGVTPSPRYVAFNEHVKIRQVVDRSLSHGAIAPPTDDDLKDATPLKLKAAATARRNARKLKAALIADALKRYDGATVLAVVPAATERVWREGPLPSWLSVTHHGATVGLDAFGHVRALYDVGRTLPAAGAVERMAGAITGVQPAVTGYRETKREIVGRDGSAVVVAAWEHPDRLCEALRWQLCEGALIQNCGRGRGLHRTADTPLDIAIWTDIAVPELGPVEHMLWQGPTADDEMLAAGVWIELPADAAKVHPELVVSAGALKQARKRYDQVHLLIWTIISKCTHSYRYRPATGQRSAVGVATFLNETSEAEARAYLEARLGPLAVLEAIAPPPEIEVVDVAATHTPLPLPRLRKPVIVWPEPGSIDRRPVDVTALFDPNRPMPWAYGLRSGVEHARN